MDSYRSIKLLFIPFFTLFLVILKLLFFLLTNAAVHMTFSKKHSQRKEEESFLWSTSQRHGKKTVCFSWLQPFHCCWRKQTPPPLYQDLEGPHVVRNTADQERHTWEKQVELMALQPMNVTWKVGIGRKCRLVWSRAKRSRRAVGSLFHLEGKATNLGHSILCGEIGQGLNRSHGHVMQKQG